MKPFSSLLTIGALLAFAGSVMAAPVPDAAAAPVPAKETQIVWHTVTHVKVVGVTKTHWVDPPTTTPTTTTTETTSTTEEETTTTTTTTSSTTTSSTTTSTTESTTEEEESTTSTTTTSTTSSTTSSTTTTEEETSTTETPTPTPPKPTIPEITIKLPTPTPEPTPEPTTEPTPEPTQESLAPPTSDGWEGDATYFDPGQGSCGITNGPGDMIAAISYLVMDPMNPGNPNNNPLCGKKIRCTRDGKNPTIITVVDRCPVCAAGDLDLSPAAYAALGGTIAEGRFTIQCSWL